MRKYFPSGHLKGIVDNYLYNDVDIFTDANRNGSLLFKMKRSYMEIQKECLKICEQQKIGEKSMQAEEMKKQQMKAKKEKRNAVQMQQPRKLKVIKPQPEPKPVFFLYRNKSRHHNLYYRNRKFC